MLTNSYNKYSTKLKKLKYSDRKPLEVTFLKEEKMMLLLYVEFKIE